MAKFLKVSPGKLVMMQPEKFQSKFEPPKHVMDIKVGLGRWTVPLVGVLGRTLAQILCCLHPESFIVLTPQLLRGHGEPRQAFIE